MRKALARTHIDMIGERKAKKKRESNPDAALDDDGRASQKWTHRESDSAKQLRIMYAWQFLSRFENIRKISRINSIFVFHIKIWERRYADVLEWRMHE